MFILENREVVIVTIKHKHLFDMWIGSGHHPSALPLYSAGTFGFPVPMPMPMPTMPRHGHTESVARVPGVLANVEVPIGEEGGPMAVPVPLRVPRPLVQPQLWVVGWPTASVYSATISYMNICALDKMWPLQCLFAETYEQ